MNKIIYSIAIILLMNMTSHSEIFYSLNVSIFPEKGILKGKASITSDKKENIKINLKGFKVYGIKEREFYTVSPEKTLSFSFEKQFKEPLITDNYIYLIKNWYPVVNSLAVYSLTVELPEDFTAISEAENIKERYSGNRKTVSFFFPYPTEAVHLIASRNFTVKEKYINGIKIKTYFFKEDKGLSDTYIRKAADYINLYQKLIGKFPYRTFSVVENLFPTGYSMPTFTLIGKQIIKYPFILNKSLPHEILHQWFGCSVYVNFQNGNWSEGLTTYLSDHFLDKDRASYRKNLILKYLAFVNKKNEYPLKDFVYKRNTVDEAIGYGKAAMFFHYLKFYLGDEVFLGSIRDFYLKNRFKRASWEDIETSFEKISKKDLSKLFDKWINKKGMVKLDIQDISSYIDTDGLFKTKIKLDKDNDTVVSTHIQSYTDKYTFLIKKNIETLATEDVPLKLALDKEYNLFRNLKEDEIPPVLYFFLGDNSPVIFVEEKNKSLYKAVIDMFPTKKILFPRDFKYSLIKNKNVIVLGKNNPVLKRMIGKTIDENGTFIKGIKNPFSERKSIFVINTNSKEKLLFLIKKINHYGSYTFVNLEKKPEKTDSKKGIEVVLNEPAVVIDKGGFISFKSLLKQIKDMNVIYVGEQHTKFSHHTVQYQIIKSLYQEGVNIAIGMEMFGRRFQKYIDMYIHGKITEEDMLKKTHYFTQWKYDYNLYKPILRFAKKHRIPVLGLNIDNKIVEKVARKGIDSLSKEDFEKIPKKVDFSNLKYKNYLLRIFGIHSSKALKNFDFFYQSQVLWDETMAETISDYLKKNKNRTVIVLAGNGHLAFGYGIPDRVKRRLTVKQAIILNGEQPEKGKADYFVFPSDIKGISSKKLGIYVEETDKGLKVESVIKTSVAEKAGIRKGDIITAFNGQKINSLSDLKILLISPPEKSSITVLRKGKKITLTVLFR